MKRYTAQEMREVAKSLSSSEVNLNFDKRDIASMLRQAADEMEREKKYEYGVKICFESEEHYALDLYDDLEAAKEMAELTKGKREILRREVGEWEEVEDEGN